MRKLFLSLAMGVTLSLSGLAALSAEPDTADRRGATLVMLRGPESIAQLNQVLVGQGVAGTDVPEAFAGPAGRIAWK